jgi:hypothetical protein
MPLTTTESARIAAVERVINIMIANAAWGWAIVVNHSLMTSIHPTAEDVGSEWSANWESEEDGGTRRAVPVLAIRPFAGPKLVFRLTEEDLAALGPCPNL